MPARIPLIERNLVNTGIRVARTAQLSNGQEGQAWGQALQNVGGVLEKFAEERRKANDATTMIELEGKMRAITSAQMQFQNDNPDQELWGKNWDELTKSFEENDLKKARLSSDARIAMSSTFGRFSQGQALSIQEAANGQASRRLRLGVENITLQAVQAGRPADVESIRPIARAGGMLPEEIDNIVLKGKEAATNQFQQNLARDYRALRNDAILKNEWQDVAALDEEAAKAGVIQAGEKEALDSEVLRGQLSYDIMQVAARDPKQALQLARDSNLPDRDKAFIERDIENKREEFQRGEMAQIADAVAMGVIKRGEDIRFVHIDSPAEQAEIRAKVNSLPPSSEQVVGEMLDLRSKIAGFNAHGFSSGDKTSMLSYVEINSRLAKLPASQREDLSKLWDKAKGGEVSVKDSFVSEGIKIVNEFYKAEEDKFFKKGIMGGKGDLKPGKEKDFAAFKLRVTQMENELKQLIPEDVTPDKAWEIISQVTGGAVTEQRKSSYTPPAQSSGFPIIPASGVEPALPGGGSLAFPILFPSIAP